MLCRNVETIRAFDIACKAALTVVRSRALGVRHNNL